MKFYVERFKEGEVTLGVLEGVKWLSCLEPVKVEIVEYLLPNLLRAKNRGNAEERSVINSILINLGFTDSDINGVGGDAGVVREWFFMERGVVMLSMCREEIKRAVYKRWGGGVRGVSNSFVEGDQVRSFKNRNTRFCCVFLLLAPPPSPHLIAGTWKPHKSAAAGYQNPHLVIDRVQFNLTAPSSYHRSLH